MFLSTAPHNSRRAQDLTSRLLAAVSRQRTAHVILDISGVGVVDTDVARLLIQTIQALRLLGCQVVLTGITAPVAASITSLGIDLAGVQTARSPQDVLMHIMGGWRIPQGYDRNLQLLPEQYRR